MHQVLRNGSQKKGLWVEKTNIQQVREDYLTLGTGNLAPRNWLKSRHSHISKSSHVQTHQGAVVWISHGQKSQEKMDVMCAAQLTWVDLTVEQTLLMVPDVSLTEESAQFPSSEVNACWAYLLQILKSNHRAKEISSPQE